MVQRKVPSQLCIEKSDHLKSEDHTGKVSPPLPCSQDSKSKGSDLNRKMKTSKSMKLSTIESCSETPKIIKQVPQPGKPPTDEKQNKTPNYMKSTSSFEARKEEYQVNSQASVKSTKKGFKNSKTSSNSAQIPAKTLARVTTLKTTASFKSTEGANKRFSQVVICEDSNSQRATCSSTLKDSKFPNYLKLSHGASESEGTSLMKVCPYTYCSLNGHRHAPLPPLKCFLSEKRQMLKTQKSTKLPCLLPQKTKPSCGLAKEKGKKAAIQEPRVVQEDQVELYVEIYAENKEDDSIIGYGNDIENNLGNSCEVMKIADDFLPQEEQMVEESEEVDFVKSNQEKETPEIVSNESEMELNKTYPKISDIEWEEGQHPTEENDGYDYEKSSSGESTNFHDANTLGTNCFDEILVDESEEVLVQSEDKEIIFIENKKDEVSNETVEDKEPSALLENHQQDSGEAQQEEIQEDYESIENNTQVYESIENDTQVYESLENYTQVYESIEDDTQGDKSIENNAHGNESIENDTQSYESIENNTQVFELDVCHIEAPVRNFLADTKDVATNQSLEQEMEEEKQNNANESLLTTDGEPNEICYDKTHSELSKVILADEITLDIDAIEMAYSDKEKTQKQAKPAYTRGRRCASEDLQSNTLNLKIIKRNKSEEDVGREREFNPRDPNYFPLSPDPESEKVDLKHQDLDDRKNAEEWMLDYALQQTVTKLGYARKKKVALLVEAFEKVAPRHHEPRVGHLSSDFSTVRHIQACS